MYLLSMYGPLFSCGRGQRLESGELRVQIHDNIAIKKVFTVKFNASIQIACNTHIQTTNDVGEFFCTTIK